MSIIERGWEEFLRWRKGVGDVGDVGWVMIFGKDMIVVFFDLL